MKALLLDALQTGLRLFPWPTETGLRRSGSPGSSSPVLVTCNYDLTVRRLMAELGGIDAWVVVAPSRGVNVWCAAAGGLLTTSQVITALKTSGVEKEVTNKRAVLPQLAATGVLGREVAKRSGWKVVFGPVHARDLPRYLEAGMKKDGSMRRVRFGARERSEMAIAWAFPTSLLLGALLALVSVSWGLVAVTQAWLMSFLVFFVYDRMGRLRWPVLWLVSATAALAWPLSVGATLVNCGQALVSTTLILAVLTFDHAGSTPTVGGSHFDSRRWAITLDSAACVGVYNCEAVCPETCFEQVPGSRTIELAHEDRCVKCGACVVQCPVDALYYQDDSGRRIEPATIRRYKLNLFGQRSVEVAGGGAV
ncbi:MAG: HgcAB-like fusion protein [Deltaproteobacteria bacterium]